MTTKELVLWGAGTNRTHRTLWLAEEFGLDYDHRPIGPRTGETKTEEFLAINPRHKIPAMVHGDICLTESAAIMTYMTETFAVPDHFYVPDGALGRARLLEWCFFTMSELDANAIYNIRRHGDLVQGIRRLPDRRPLGDRIFRPPARMHGGPDRRRGSVPDGGEDQHRRLSLHVVSRCGPAL